MARARYGVTASRFVGERAVGYTCCPGGAALLQHSTALFCGVGNQQIAWPLGQRLPSPYNRRIDVWGVLAIAEMRTRIMRPGTRIQPSIEDAVTKVRC